MAWAPVATPLVMLFVGHGDFDEHHLTEAKSHFALWSMLSAPLLIGYDLRNAPQPLMDILGNADIIAVNQDAAGNQAVLAYDSDDVQILVKTLSNGHKAVAIFNRGLAPTDVTLTAGHMVGFRLAPASRAVKPVRMGGACELVGLASVLASTTPPARISLRFGGADDFDAAPRMMNLSDRSNLMLNAGRTRV